MQHLTFLQQARKFLKPVKVLWKRYLMMFIVAFVCAILNLVTIRIISWVSDLIVAWNITKIYEYTFRYGLLIALFYLLLFLGSRNERYTVYDTLDYLKSKYLRTVINLENNYYESLWTGKTIDTMNTGTMSRTTLLQQFFNYGLGSLISIIGSFLFIANIWFIPFLGTFAFLVVSTIGFFAFNNKRNFFKRARKRVLTSMAHHNVKIIMSKFEIQLNNQIDNEVKVINDLNKEQKQIFIKENVYIQIIKNVPQFLLDAGKVAIILFVWVWAIKWIYSVWTFVLFMGILTRLEASINELLNLLMTVSQEFINIEKLRETFDDGPKIKNNNSDFDKEFSFKQGEIEFSKITFFYQDTKHPVFKDFNLKLKPASKTALVGVSGSGKSTLIKMIGGYVHPQQGSIIIDGQKLADLKLHSYYRHIGYLTQEPSVFDGTIIENLKFWVLWEVNEQAIKTAIELANCWFVYELSHGLETQIGEKGIKLSWWQRQRLAIAKVFLKNPQIILLDEPTSALDSFSEELISQSLHTLFQHKTVIVIAHRLQTVKQADDIIVFDKIDGLSQIIERGTHNQLVAMNGSYAKMLELQSGF